MEENKKLSPQEISNEMVCSIANLAALGVDGIDKMFMKISDEILDVIYPSAVSKGVNVVKKEEGYRIDLHVITELGIDIPKVAKQTQIKVKESVEIMTGYQVALVNVHVEGSGKY
ncbi:MAG: Asp23/Gls24 family envelope stress response protein [Eubacterium sp.]